MMTTTLKTKSRVPQVVQYGRRLRPELGAKAYVYQCGFLLPVQRGPGYLHALKETLLCLAARVWFFDDWRLCWLDGGRPRISSGQTRDDDSESFGTSSTGLLVFIDWRSSLVACTLLDYLTGLYLGFGQTTMVACYSALLFSEMQVYHSRVMPCRKQGT